MAAMAYRNAAFAGRQLLVGLIVEAGFIRETAFAVTYRAVADMGMTGLPGKRQSDKHEH